MTSETTLARVPSPRGVATTNRPPVAPARRRTLWTVITGATGVVTGLAPHVLHHIGPLVGTFLVAGAGGTALFGVVGLVASTPMLIKLRTKFSSWWAPTIAFGFFTVAFLISTLVLGPLISSGRGDSAANPTEYFHAEHHGE